jgi:hypothetical protein
MTPLTGHHGGMRPQIAAISAGLGLVLAGSAGIAVHAGATTPVPVSSAGVAKPTCVVVVLTPRANSVLQLDVSAVTATKGECVRFRNKTNTTATVDVRGTTYRQVIRAGGITSGKANYTATANATVDAVSGLRSGSSPLTVTAASPQPSSSPSGRPTTSPSASPTSTAKASASASASGSASASPHRRKGKIVLPPLPPLPSGGVSGGIVPSNPLVAPGETTPGSEPVSGTQSIAAAATVLEPTSGSGRGLPVLVALVVLVGLIAGFGRVVLAVPNRPESRDRRRHRA